MFKKSNDKISNIRILINYFIRFILIILTKIITLKIRLIGVLAFEDHDNSDPTFPLIEFGVNNIQYQFTYSSDEKFLVFGEVECAKMRFKPTSSLPDDRMEFFISGVNYKFKFPGSHDLTNAFFNSSVTATVAELTGNYSDKAFITFIQFFIKTLLIKQLRRCVYFQIDPLDHKNKFNSALLAADVVKIVSSKAPQINKV